MTKICQKYYFLFFIGLLPLVPFVTGCGGCTPKPTPEPTPVNTADDAEQKAAEEAKAAEEQAEAEAAAAKAAEEKAAAEKAAAEMKAAAEKAAAEKAAAERAAEVKAAAEKAAAEMKAAAEKAIAEAAAKKAEEEEAARKAAEEAAKAPPVNTDDPVNQTSPVDQTPPVDTESPVDTTPPVQGGDFSLSLANREPTTVLVSQVDQAENETVSPAPAEETPVTPPAVAPQVPVTPGAEGQQGPPQGRQRGGQFQPQPGTQGPGQQPELQPLQPLQPVQPGMQGPGQQGPPQRFQQGGNQQPGQPGMQGPGQQGPPQRFQQGGQQPGAIEQGIQARDQQRAQQPGQPGMQGPPGRGNPELPTPSVVRIPRLDPAETVIFNFRYAPWKDVFEWFANEAAMSLQANRIPTGTLNLIDGKPYTPTEALDILNSHLLWQDYSLLRKGRVLFVVYLPDGIPPNLLEPIPPSELDQRGKYEICKCVFTLNRTTPEVIETEVQRLLGSQGSVVVLSRSQQIVITETGGTLRTIREMIRRIDDPEGVAMGSFHTIDVKNTTADDALQIARALLAIDTNDASLRAVVDSSGKRIYVSGRGDMVEKLKDVVQRIDTDLESRGDLGQPQFVVHDTGSADPATVLAVLQTLLAGKPDVRLSLDPSTRGISVLGRLTDQATVREAIKQMNLNVPQVDIIPLKRMSPLTAVETIKRFYQTTSLATTTQTDTAGRGPQGQGQGQGRQQTNQQTQPPVVEADSMARQIIVKGTITQITEIRALLAKLGEDGTAGPAATGSLVRAVPLSPTAASLVLEQLRTIDSGINIVAPQAKPEPEVQPTPSVLVDPLDSLIDETFEKEEAIPILLELPMTLLMRLAEEPILAQVFDLGEALGGANSPLSGVTVTLTPGGFVLTSDDPEKLDKAEELIRMLSDESVLGRPIFKEYYLVNATASVVSSSLQNLMGTGTGLGASGIASVDLPEWQHAELFGYVAAGSGIEKTGTVTIAVEDRLNALFIQANPVDHETIKGLLKILDQPNRDDILRNPVPRFLPLTHMRAEDAKTMVEQAFVHKMQGNRGGQQGAAANPQQRGQQPQMPGAMIMGPGGQQMPGGPAAMMQAFMQQAQQGGRQNTAREQEPAMTLSVAGQTNSLIVTSTESTFNEVKTFVEAMDADAAQRTKVMVTEQLTYTSPALAQRSLMNMLGSAASVTLNNQTATQSGFGGTGGTFGGGTTGFGGQQQRPGGTTIGGATGFGGQQQRPGGTTIGGGIGGQQARPGGAMGGTTIGGGAARPGGAMGGTTIGGGAARPGGTTIGGR